MVKVLQRREDGLFKLLEQRLAENEYLAGGVFTCADIMAIFPLTTLSQHMGKTYDDSPNTADYIERLTSRPAYQKAMSIAGVNATRDE